jgi:cyclic pyranopterin phosphate synthase
MPAEGNELKPKEELLSFEEIYRVAKVFVDMGIEKIRLTGGEPLVRKDIEVLVRKLRTLPIRTLAMTTNAVLLKQKARSLKDAGMDALNISLDTLRRDRFMEIARRDDFDNVIEGINETVAVGFSSVKLNVVVMSGRNDDEILDFIEFVRHRNMNVRFIEYMPFKDNQWTEEGVFGYSQMREQIESKYKLHPLPIEEGAVAKDFAIEGYPATVSFISSMTDSFCSTCNRLRLTADGNIKSCLFSPSEVNVRDIIRGGASDLGLESAIQAAVLLKPAEHPPMEELARMDNRAMVDIGG